MATIERVETLPLDRMDPLVAEADARGFRALARLVDGWRSGRNRFDRPGEALFLAREDGTVVGVCGLNVDPYLGDPAVRRVRHLYVAVGHQRQGIGTGLIR